MVHENGARATASVAVFKAKFGYQSYAYLRFKSGGLNSKIYVGNVTAETRDEALRVGWTLVKAKQVVEPHGWRWLQPSESNSSELPRAPAMGKSRRL